MYVYTYLHCTFVQTWSAEGSGSVKDVVIKELNRHYTVEEVFERPILAVRGFTEKITVRVCTRRRFTR